ncbi:hypothetical protein FQN60_009089 [Etheostoma spectabile]|uniref:Laminin subunit alpha-5 n=1 Tax=Etheostoma spectabile TaxID=54343 RepID=A0A5J5CN75_9PERO|nr:hypothetical protein FQN60_009089 [Etheostoma spectabile]
MDVHGHHRGGGVCLNCQHHTTGANCERCIPTYYRSPDHSIDSPLACSRCDCQSEFTDGTCEDLTGRCFCKPNYAGEDCRSCASGLENFPNCYPTPTYPSNNNGEAKPAGEIIKTLTEQNSGSPRSSLNCVAAVQWDLYLKAAMRLADVCVNQNFRVLDVNNADLDSTPTLTVKCAPVILAPQWTPAALRRVTATACLITVEQRVTSALLVTTVTQVARGTGQCVCLPNVQGLRCNSCAHGAYGFPNCQAGTCHPAGSVQHVVPPPVGQCECRGHVEGPACDTCKALYWDLSPDTPDGCTNCECNIAGTASGVAECAQESGQCHCKPNACSGTCSTCKDGYYNLQEQNYFGCQGCQCDMGGSAGQSCGERNGRCRCRPNLEGPQCNLPRPDHYFPDLHHLKFEIEEGSVLDGRPVRFGYNPLEFPDFSWRGYAQMSPIQSKVLVAVAVSSPDLFHVVLRYANRGGSDVRGRVSTAVKLQVYVSEADVYLTRFILRYVNSEGATSNGKITAYQANRRGSEQSKQIVFAASAEPTFVNVPQNNFVEPFVLNPGTWTVVIEAEGILLDYLVLLPSAYYEAPILQIRVTEPCSYSSAPDASHNCLQYRYLSLDSFPSFSANDASCRHDNHLPRPCPTERVTPRHPDMAVCSGNDISVELRGRLPSPGDYVLVVEYSSEEELPQTLSVSVTVLGARFLCRVVAIDEQNRHKVYLVPRKQFTMEYVEPKTPSDSLVLKEGQSSSMQEPVPAPPLPPQQKDESAWIGGDRPPLGADNSQHVRLDSLQNAAMYSARVHALGRYVFILHYHQPLHANYPVQVYINGGRIWQGQANASFCPHAYGCRNVLVSENQIILDVTDHEVFLTVQIPAGRTLWLDYVLVVPESRYSSSYLNEEPLDKSYDFISSCGQNSFYINPSTASPFCLSSAVSLSAFFNNGALPCACHEVGAQSDTCESFGGQCHCRPNVIGRDCSMCATGFWGFPNCRPCSCGSRLCEPVTGDCICPPRTVLPECTQCEPQTFGCHPVVGCEVCNCSRPGVLSPDVNCDTLSGQCRCKNNVVGRQCDRCAPGFYGYPNCRPCDCNEAGTEEEVCDSFTGQCLCKENVQGSRCDQCRVGTFHLDPTNPKGCTSCFCFGATNRCRSSDKRRIEVMNMEGWVLLSADKQEVPVAVYPGQDLVEADLSDVPDVYQDLHWHAPKTYLGDKVSSYGGYLRYRLHTQTMRGDVLSLPAEASRPDIILKGNQMSLVFMEREYSSPEEPHLGIVHMVEELMMVLVGLESLQIRALHSQSAHSVSLRGAVLEAAENLPAGRHANNVEICMCPANYLGDSCQKCAPGYYRDTIGLFLGKCVPCNCNGHSDHCLDGSGICLNCQHNTAGDHCERCLGGFLGNNSLDGQAVSCSSCPCPLRVPSNNFAEGCVQKVDRMQCLCMPGYAGPHCERCAPGYYGNPMVLGSRCQLCHCHGNTDTNMLFTDCHPLTGECLSCMHNTAGPHCDICAPGYYGDAVIAKNCTKCKCSPCGTESCDPHTGQCRCKAGDARFGFDSCSGCRQCDCDASAALVQPCDPRSGQCACQPGVNGPSCKQCAPGHWDYGPNGCKKCNCRGGRCDPRTGECRCPDGMTGKQCDTCSQKYSVPVEQQNGMHCEPCDSCVIVLLEDLDKINANVSSVASQLSSLNASSMAWAQLHSLNKSVEDIARAIENYNSTLDDSSSRADMMEAEIMNINDDIDELQGKVSGMIARDDGDRERKMREVQAMLREMRYRSCVGQKKVADREKSEAHKLLERVNKELAGLQGENSNLAQGIRERLSRFHADMMELRDALNQAVNNTARAAEINNGNEKTLEDNQRRIGELLLKQKEVTEQLHMAEDDIAQVNHVVPMLHDSKEEYERLAAQLDGARTPLAKKVQHLALADSKIPLVEEAERHAELLNALAMNLSSLVAETKKGGFVDVTKAYNNIINKLKPQLEDAQRRLGDAKTKQAAVMKDLDMVQNNLNFTTNVNQEIGEAKRVAHMANVTAIQVNDALRPIKDQLDQWQQAYGDANATNDDINNALMEANKTVHVLGETIPLLMKKLDKLQNHSTQMPNISENISRIRQLIQQARNAASKVSVSVKFNGESGVQVRTPPNVADLAAYTSLKFYITLPEATRTRRQDNSKQQFVFYLGNKDSSKEFLGMALEGKRLHWFFNIGGETAEVVMTEDVKSDGNFNSIVLERILQYGQMSMSSEATEGHQAVKADVEAGGDQGLLNLLTDDTVFYVGGYPSTFKPPSQLALPNFKGCIELDTLNEEVLSLYNFENIFQLNTTKDVPCGRSKQALTQAWVNDAAYFDGTGFAEILLNEETSRIQRFEQEVKLISHNGILLLLQKESQFLCLAVLKGTLKVFYDFSGDLLTVDPKEPSSDLLKISDAEPNALEIIILYNQNRVVVRNNRNHLFTLQYTQSLPLFYSNYYLGGVPENKMPEKLKALFPKQGSLKGCFRNVAREAHFSGESYLDMALTNIPTLMNNFYASFSFRTEQKEGLMFYHHDQEGVCQVFLHEGYVVVRAGNSEIKTQKTYNDDRSHNIAFYNNINGMRVYMDDVLEKAKESIRLDSRRGVMTTQGSTFLGGIPNQSLTNLTGCIRNAFIRRETSPQMVLNLLKAQDNFNVPLKCPTAKTPQQIVAAQPKQSSKPRGKQKKPSGSRSRNTREWCQGEPLDREAGATHFSGSTHTDAQHGGAVMSLSVSDGHLLLLLDGGKRKVSLRSRKKYDDNQWHTVFLKREGEKISLIVDGISAQSKRFPAGDRSRLTGPLYVGGVPSSLTAPGSGGFIGCVRDLTLNQAPARSPAHSQGTVPCFQNPLQPGSLVLGRDLEIQLEVRPVSESGLLLHAGTSPDQHLSLVLSQGEVTVSVNSGKGEFSTSFTPEEPLCNGRWHTITVVKKNNVLQLHVDSASEHSVGPKQSRSAGAKETVYLGGVPNGVTVPGLPASLPVFHGCIRQAFINHRPAMLSKPLAVHGAVGTQGCPHM